MSTTWFNGAPVAGEAWTGTRALHYGDGVFRTLLVIDGHIHECDRQLARLQHDAEALQLEVPQAERLRDEAQRLIAGCDRGVLRLSLSRADSGRGYTPHSDACDRFLQLRALPAHPQARWKQGANLNWSPVLLGIQRCLAGIKHCNRVEQVLASRNWAADQHEALMCDTEGRVISGTRSNAFFVIDGILVTPDLSTAGVQGVTRDRLIELACTHGPGCEIGTISPDEVRHASEAFICNSLIGIWPLRRVGGLEFPTPGPVTAQMMELLQHPWSGE